MSLPESPRPEDKSPARPLFMALLAALLFGAATPVSKILLSSLPALKLAGLLSLGSALAALPFALKGGGLHKPWQLPRESRNKLSLSLGFGGILGPVLLLLGLNLASAGSVSMWLNLELVFTALFAWLFFGDYLGARGWLAVAGAIGAASLLSWGEGTAALQAGLWVALACVCWALDNNATATLDGIAAAETVFWKGLVAGTVNISLGFALAPEFPPVIPALLCLVVGALSFGTSIMLFISAQHALGATRTQTIFSSAPFWGLLIAAVFLGEGVTVLQLLAALILVGVLALILRDKHTHSHEHEAHTHTHAHRHDDGHHEHSHESGETGEHSHEHSHLPLRHSHAHWSDLHHRHAH